jgi:hypothetical protein
VLEQRWRFYYCYCYCYYLCWGGSVLFGRLGVGYCECAEVGGLRCGLIRVVGVWGGVMARGLGVFCSFSFVLPDLSFSFVLSIFRCAFSFMVLFIHLLLSYKFANGRPSLPALAILRRLPFVVALQLRAPFRRFITRCVVYGGVHPGFRILHKRQRPRARVHLALHRRSSKKGFQGGKRRGVVMSSF